MNRSKQPFSIFKKHTGKGKKIFYYAKFRDQGTGDYWKRISTGCSNRVAAALWAKEELKKEEDIKKSGTLLRNYCAGFWDPGSDYARAKTARGFSLSMGFLEVSESNTRNHILPVWGDCCLDDITPGKIDKWILELYKEGTLAPPTVNKILQTLKTILDRAVTEKLIKENPAEFVKPVRNAIKKRGVFTPGEIKLLFQNQDTWIDIKHYTINLLACTTGARMGEIRGLKIDCLHSDYIEIKRSWEEGHGLKPPKYDSVRDVPISKKVFEALDHVVHLTRPEGILFYSAASKDRPLSKSVIQKGLYSALAAIGITELERRQRNLVFHSWRHTLNSILRSRGIPDIKVKLITGHRSDRMSDHYTHFKAGDYEDVLSVTGEIV